jgi:UDP-N-acetylglucosamine 2-epimerase (non-hydrolysing)
VTPPAHWPGPSPRYVGVPLAHVEAGLPTGRDDPFPEEMHRCTIATLAHLHFAPTPAAAAALRAEGVAEAAIIITGNTGIDALLTMRARLAHDRRLQARAARPLAGTATSRPWVLATIHRRENHGARLEGVLSALAALSAEAQVIVPVHSHPAVAAPVQARLGHLPGVSLLPPLGYASFVWLMGRARLVLTDSGGVQEEAPALGLPCLVLRHATERPEGVASGHARLVGTDRARILAATRAALARPAAAPALPYGNGRAAGLIMDRLLGARPHQAAA